MAVKIKLQLVRKSVASKMRKHFSLLQQSLQLDIYVTRMVGLQNILIRSNCRKLYQPRTSTNIIPDPLFKSLKHYALIKIW